MAHRPPLSWRFWVYSATAYLLPLVVHVGLPAEGAELDNLVWLVTLVPAFLLALHYGLRGAFVALVLGIGLILGVELLLAMTATPADPPVTASVVMAYGALAISVGWLSEQLHEHYEYALELQADQRTEALGSMAAGIAHDFNNILTAMVANGELIDAERKEAQGEPERAASDPSPELAHLHRAAERGAGIVRKLLGFSRRGALRLRTLDPVEVVGEQMEVVRRLASDRVAVRFETEEDLPPVLADREAVEAILSNLVTNARDAMPAGGLLEVILERGRLGREHLRRTGWGTPGEYVCLVVTDTGTGMNPETLSRIYDPFFTTKEPGEGVGLGLAMVYGLVKQHRGFVDVESAPSQGTTVRVYLPPAEKEEAASAPVVPEGSRQSASETVLVVEDDEGVRRAGRRILERAGYTVVEAADGEEAVERYHERAAEVDLVLTDVVLPKRSGPEFYRAIRRSQGDPPVLFMSGYPARAVEESQGLDPDLPFLQKPWTADALVEAVREVLRKGVSAASR